MRPSARESASRNARVTRIDSHHPDFDLNEQHTYKVEILSRTVPPRLGSIRGFVSAVLLFMFGVRSGRHRVRFAAWFGAVR